MRMKAFKTFRVSDTGRTVNPGDEFDAKNGLHYEKLGLAHAVHAVAQPAAAKEASAPDPLRQAGGETGETKQSSSSPAAPAPQKRSYRRRVGARES